MKTVSRLPFNLSPKALLAFLTPFLTAVGAVLVSYIVTGDWNETETRAALGGLVTAALALLGAYVGQPAAVDPVHEVSDLHDVAH